MIVSDEDNLEINEMIVYELLQYDSLRKLSFKYLKTRQDNLYVQVTYQCTFTWNG